MSEQPNILDNLGQTKVANDDIGDREKFDSVNCNEIKLELGDLDSVAKAMEANIPVLADMVDKGYDLIAPVPSCVLMFKQELPLMFPDDSNVQKVKQAFFDPFEYLFLRHKAEQFNIG